MSEAVAARGFDATGAAEKLLAASGVLWFIPACIGQWTFAAYITLQYVAPALRGDLSGWNDVMVNGIIRGDLVGNVALGIHLFIALVITVGGTLQLMPAIRKRAPVFHRWNGRLYIVIALIASIAAFYMVWTRDQIGGLINDIAISIDGALIIFFAMMAVRAARARRFDQHHRWALRTFLAVSGVWYMRVSYGFLILMAQGQPPGTSRNMDGPLDIAVGFGSYLLPLAVLEIYFRAQRSRSAPVKLGAALVVMAGATVTAIGVFGATMIMWLPRMS